MGKLIYIDYDNIDLVIDTTVEVVEITPFGSKTREFKPLREEDQKLEIEVFFKSGVKVTLSGEGVREVLDHYANSNQ